MTDAYETVIGLEVHCQLLTQSKLFCGCSTRFGAEPNSHVCPVCLGLPGALPVPNAAAIQLAMRAALALECTVREHSVFARKNYFYPDMSKNYQISQYELPLNEDGRLRIEVEGAVRDIGIERIHLEEDAAKNLHGVGSGTATLVDFNRGGTALIEIVSRPELRSAAEAEAYLRRLREILMACGVNDGNLEEGSFRCDANVSIRPMGQEKLGTRTELKNINSFRFVRKAIEYEAARQRAVVSSGGVVVQETRTWHETQEKTITMRAKEEAMDYRYFPDPDLPPLRVSQADIEAVRETLPELPADKRARYRTELGLTDADAALMTSHPRISEYFERGAAQLRDQAGLAIDKAGKRVANFIQSEVMRYVTTDGLAATFPVQADDVAELLALVEGDTISGKMAKGVFATMIETGKRAKQVVDEQGLAQMSDTAALEEIIRSMLADHSSQVAEYRAGKKGLLGFFVGKVMKATKGSANPKVVNELLTKLLEEP